MLPDLPHQGVEGILNSLGKRSMAWSSYPLLGGTVEGGKDTSKVSLTLSSSADSRVKVQNQAGKTNKDLSVALKGEQD